MYDKGSALKIKGFRLMLTMPIKKRVSIGWFFTWYLNNLAAACFWKHSMTNYFKQTRSPFSSILSTLCQNPVTFKFKLNFFLRYFQNRQMNKCQLSLLVKLPVATEGWARHNMVYDYNLDCHHIIRVLNTLYKKVL